MSAEDIIKTLVSMLRHLQTIPLDEVRENIRVMIDALQSSASTMKKEEKL